VDVDHVAPLARIPELLAALTAEAAPHVDVPDDIRIEAEMSGPFGSSAARVDAIGDRIPMSCPSCGGPLWTVHGGGDVYRCSVGHAFTPAALLAGQSDELERGLWIAVRTLEERAGVLSSLARDSAARGFPERVYEQRAAEASRYARQLRDLLVRICTGGRASRGETEED